MAERFNGCIPSVVTVGCCVVLGLTIAYLARLRTGYKNNSSAELAIRGRSPACPMVSPSTCRKTTRDTRRNFWQTWARSGEAHGRGGLGCSADSHAWACPRSVLARRGGAVPRDGRTAVASF